ncbi:unnamed protein product [Vitrella brassicaformis CCMP3155]|uniref:Protein kinase domain-containing protein n=4 Tax=Vitrella brassicaformis TaxID=1169539 RepID=A0A0G4F3U3_VITBC|nr:unnamed protein product [Vitrella brassicaformis CCMP3155]|eukprot:CEM06595.1 unnamed protein product [Vitrella brassicaformis CCMP3155]
MGTCSSVPDAPIEVGAQGKVRLRDVFEETRHVAVFRGKVEQSGDPVALRSVQIVPQQPTDGHDGKREGRRRLEASAAEMEVVRVIEAKGGKGSLGVCGGRVDALPDGGVRAVTLFAYWPVGTLKQCLERSDGPFRWVMGLTPPTRRAGEAVTRPYLHEDDVTRLFAHICDAVDFLHTQDICMGRLSLSDVWLDTDGTPRLKTFTRAARMPPDGSPSFYRPRHSVSRGAHMRRRPTDRMKRMKRAASGGGERGSGGAVRGGEIEMEEMHHGLLKKRAGVVGVEAQVESDERAAAATKATYYDYFRRCGLPEVSREDGVSRDLSQLTCLMYDVCFKKALAHEPAHDKRTNKKPSAAQPTAKERQRHGCIIPESSPSSHDSSLKDTSFARLRIPPSSLYSQALHDLLRSLTHPLPTRRPALPEIRAHLAHLRERRSSSTTIPLPSSSKSVPIRMPSDDSDTAMSFDWITRNISVSSQTATANPLAWEDDSSPVRRAPRWRTEQDLSLPPLPAAHRLRRCHSSALTIRSPHKYVRDELKFNGSVMDEAISGTCGWGGRLRRPAGVETDPAPVTTDDTGNESPLHESSPQHKEVADVAVDVERQVDSSAVAGGVRGVQEEKQVTEDGWGCSFAWRPECSSDTSSEESEAQVEGDKPMVASMQLRSVAKATESCVSAADLVALQRIVLDLWTMPNGTAHLAKCIEERPVLTDRVVAFKALIVLHRAMQQGPTTITAQPSIRELLQKLHSAWLPQKGLRDEKRKKDVLEGDGYDTDDDDDTSAVSLAAMTDYCELLLLKMTTHQKGPHFFQGNWSLEHYLSRYDLDLDRAAELEPDSSPVTPSMVDSLLHFAKPVYALTAFLLQCLPMEPVSPSASPSTALLISALQPLLDELQGLLGTVTHLAGALVLKYHAQSRGKDGCGCGGGEEEGEKGQREVRRRELAEGLTGLRGKYVEFVTVLHNITGLLSSLRPLYPGLYRLDPPPPLLVDLFDGLPPFNSSGTDSTRTGNYSSAESNPTTPTTPTPPPQQQPQPQEQHPAFEPSIDLPPKLTRVLESVAAVQLPGSPEPDPFLCQSHPCQPLLLRRQRKRDDDGGSPVSSCGSGSPAGWTQFGSHQERTPSPFLTPLKEQQDGGQPRPTHVPFLAEGATDMGWPSDFGAVADLPHYNINAPDWVADWTPSEDSSQEEGEGEGEDGEQKGDERREQLSESGRSSLDFCPFESERDSDDEGPEEELQESQPAPPAAVTAEVDDDEFKDVQEADELSSASPPPQPASPGSPEPSKPFQDAFETSCALKLLDESFETFMHRQGSMQGSDISAATVSDDKRSLGKQQSAELKDAVAKLIDDDDELLLASTSARFPPSPPPPPVTPPEPSSPPAAPPSSPPTPVGRDGTGEGVKILPGRPLHMRVARRRSDKRTIPVACVDLFSPLPAPRKPPSRSTDKTGPLSAPGAITHMQHNQTESSPKAADNQPISDASKAPPQEPARSLTPPPSAVTGGRNPFDLNTNELHRAVVAENEARSAYLGGREPRMGWQGRAKREHEGMEFIKPNFRPPAPPARPSHPSHEAVSGPPSNQSSKAMERSRHGDTDRQPQPQPPASPSPPHTPPAAATPPTPTEWVRFQDTQPSSSSNDQSQASIDRSRALQELDATLQTVARKRAHKRRDRDRERDRERHPAGKAARDRDSPSESSDGAPTAEWEVPPHELTFGERVGSGATSEVYRGMWRGTEVAIKRLSTFLSLDDLRRMAEGGGGQQRALQEFLRELQIMRRLRHPNLVLFMGMVTKRPPLCVITEYCAGGTLFDLLHNHPNTTLSWQQKLKIAIDVAKGMTFLHTCNPPIVHRDLKSLNLLLSEQLVSPSDLPTVKVSDFGLSRLFGAPSFPAATSKNAVMTGAAGTYHWMAPEVLEGRPYGAAVDVFSYGIVLYELFARRIPYEELGLPPVGVGLAVAKGRRPDLRLIGRDCPHEMRRLMELCWAHEPSQRPSFERILAHLRDMRNAPVPSPAPAPCGPAFGYGYGPQPPQVVQGVDYQGRGARAVIPQHQQGFWPIMNQGPVQGRYF